MKKVKSCWPILVLITIAGIPFWPFLSKGLIPLPADIVIGAYHPFKDVVWQGREAGFPVKNFTIFDPARQLYPWRFLAIDRLVKKIQLKWFLVFVFSLSLSLLAGYLQVVIYIYLLVFFCFLYRVWEGKRRRLEKKLIIVLVGGMVLSLFLVAFQALPTFELLIGSGRATNPQAATRFFLPWRHLIMFVAPDFFGNPATGNYWGAENYTEFCGYAGILTLFLVFLTLFSRQISRQRKEARFWQLILLFSFIFVTPNFIAQFPYRFKIPLFSNLTPSRLIFLINFSLAVLAAFGFDWLLKEESRKALRITVRKAVSLLVRSYVLAILVFLAGVLFWPFWQKNVLVSFRNLILPFGLLLINLFGISLFLGFKSKKARRLTLGFLLLVLIFDLLRQAKKYNSFIEPELIFPTTKTIEFLQKQKEPFRFQKADVELFPGNFQIIYGLEAIDGYDPFFSRRFAALVSVGNGFEIEKMGQEFERDIFLGNHASSIFELLNTKYVLSLRDLSDEPHLKLLMEEGKTRLYENLQAGPRAFLVDEIIVEPDDKKALSLMLKRDLHREVILEKEVMLSSEVDEMIKEEKVGVSYPSVNKAVVEVITPKEKILVLADSFYPGWKVLVDGQPKEILRVDYNLRGVAVPAGKHTVEFIYDPLSFKLGLVISFLTVSGLLGFFFRSRIGLGLRF